LVFLLGALVACSSAHRFYMLPASCWSAQHLYSEMLGK